jgi:thiamine-monophosphate kinase
LCDECKATQITVSDCSFNRFPLEALDELFAGLHMLQNNKVDVIGGDYFVTKGLIISITAIG